MNALPLTVDELIDQLNKMYPNRCPRVTDSDRTIWMDVGSRRVVDHLLSLRQRRDDNILDTKNV